MSESAIHNPQSTITDEPSGWHVGFHKRELAEALTERMGWKRSSCGVEAIYNNPMNTDQIADVLGALDRRDDEIERLRKLLIGIQPEDVDEVAAAEAGRCLYCGFDPCRCGEADAVGDGLQSQGAAITDSPQRAQRIQRKGVLNG